MYSGGKVGLVSVLSVGFANDCVRSDQLAEVVHNETGKDFLPNVLHFFSVKTEQTKGIFELAERGFDAPALVVEGFDLIGGEADLVEICDDGLEAVVGNTKADNAKAQSEETVIVKRKRREINLIR